MAEQNYKNLATLYETSKVINSSLDIDTILKNIVDIVIKKLRYDDFSILLAEGDKLVVKKDYRSGKVISEKKEFNIKIGEGVTGSSAKSGIWEMINDVTKDRRYIKIREGIGSELAVPVKIGDKVIGVFNVEAEKKNAFTKNDLFLLSALADHASIAIQNANKTKSLMQSNQRLKYINEIGKLVNSSLNLDIIFKKFLEYASKEVKYNFCAILMVENNKLYIKAGIGISKKQIDAYSAELGEGICGMAVKTGKPIIANDVSKVSFYKKWAPRTKSEISIPLKVEGSILGALDIESEELNAFGDDDAVYLSALAEKASVAIRNAQLYNKIRNFNMKLKKRVASATRNLRLANIELERLNNLKSDFVSIVSHELRTPLTSIYGYVSLVSDGETGPITGQQMEFLSIAKVEIERLTRLINDILDISKIESGNMEMKFENFNILKFMSEYKKEVKNMALEKNIKVTFLLPKKLPIIMADRDKIKQILDNLISNAIKFSEANTELKVIIKEKNEFISFDVADHGIGIAKRNLDKIFGKFQQVDSKMTRKEGGTGLGLAIVKNLVKFHNGEIWVRSTPGKGSKFSFTISKHL